MYLKNLLKPRGPLALRLTLWYTGIFSVSSIIIFFVLYFIINSTIQDRTDASLLIEANEISTLMQSKGLQDVKQFIRLESESGGSDNLFFRLISFKGEGITDSDTSSWKDMVIPNPSLRRQIKNLDYALKTFITSEHPEGIRVLHKRIGTDVFIQIGHSLKQDRRLMESFRNIFSVTFLILITLAALIGWLLARRTLLRVEAVTRTAIEISDGALEKRVPVRGGEDEIDRLAAAFNIMLNRIQSLIKGMTDMTDNIAHDLRSPITKIRGVAEMTLIAGKSISEFEAMAANTMEESDRLLEMINTMLDISEFEAGARKLTVQEVDVSEMVNTACDLFRPISERKDIEIISNISPSCIVEGDRQRLQRMVANLLDNALKYNPNGGKVQVSVNVDNGQLLISVGDTGIGISEEDMPHIFKRFYRCDRSRSEIGDGLGLSWALAVAQAHGGNIVAKSNPNKGSTFLVTLPHRNGSPMNFSSQFSNPNITK